MKKNKISQDRYDVIKEELSELKQVTRKEVAQEIKESREKGDLGNNREFDLAREKQRATEKRITELERVLNNAIVMKKVEKKATAIGLGSKVTILDKEYNEWIDYEIVESEKADILSNKLSIDSPLGQALLGRKQGQTVKINTERGAWGYEVIKFEGGELVEKSHDINSVVKTGKTAEIKVVGPKDFITRVNFLMCSKKAHKLSDIRCKVTVLKKNGKKEEVLVPGAYCKICDHYYILESEFSKLKLKGVIICKVVEQEYWISQGKSEYQGYNQESLLHMMGYNVNMQKKLSEKQRWGILEIIVNEGILSRAEISSHLNWLIKRNSNNHNFDDARKKWECDNSHILNYDVDNVSIVNVKTITNRQNKHIKN